MLRNCWPLITVFLVVLCGLCQITLSLELLAFNDELIKQGEFWRLISGHLMHLDVEHFVWNMLALLLIGGMLEQLNRRCFVQILSLSWLTVSIYLLLAGKGYYCGFSALLNGLFYLLLWQLWQRQPHPLLLLVGAAGLAKLLVEVCAQQALFSQLSWPPDMWAHMVGAGTGLLLIIKQSPALRRLRPEPGILS